MVGVLRRLRGLLLSNWFRVILSVSALAVFITLWSLYSAWLHGDWPFSGAPHSSTPDVLPYPWEVLAAFFNSFTHREAGLYMTGHIYASLKRITLGFVLAFCSAVPIGLLMGRSRNADAVGRPIMELLRPIPPIAWVPIFLIALGFLWGPVAIVFLGIFFPILFNVILGARSVDPVLIDAARTLGAGRMDVFAKVVLPFTLPYMMTGVKVGLGIGWMCIVAAEMLGAVGGGVGYYINTMAYQYSAFDKMFGGMLVIGLLSVLTTGVAAFFERRMMRWMKMK